MGSNGMTEPIIQVSGAIGHTDNYCAAIRASGGIPAAGYCPAPDLSCAGLVLCGGGDIAYARYAGEDLGSQPPDLAKDEAEFALFHAFFQAGKPILGICRGMQLINVALGGTLIQDLPIGTRLFHSGKSDMVHPVRAEENSILHQLYGPIFHVNSSHHQAAGQLGQGLTASAWSESNFAEAIEMPGRPVLGVQFHPERMSFSHRRLDTVDGAAIFSWFLTLCRSNYFHT